MTLYIQPDRSQWWSVDTREMIWKHFVLCFGQPILLDYDLSLLSFE
jgi:hypothetical protein